MSIARICILSIVVAGCGSQEYTVPTGVTVLGEKELLDEMTGNTHTGVLDSGMPWTEYFEPPKGDEKNGRVSGKGRTMSYTGKWKIDRSLMCFEYPDSDNSGCWTVAIDGNKVVWYKPDGTRHSESTRIPGNPNGFQ